MFPATEIQKLTAGSGNVAVLSNAGKAARNDVAVTVMSSRQRVVNGRLEPCEAPAAVNGDAKLLGLREQHFLGLALRGERGALGALFGRLRLYDLKRSVGKNLDIEFRAAVNLGVHHIFLVGLHSISGPLGLRGD